MNLSQRLAHIEDIKVLKARYCRYADTKDWDNYFSLFADDLEFEFVGAQASGGHWSVSGTSGESPAGGGASAEPGRGKAAWMTWVRETSSSVLRSAHHCHTPEISLESDSEATGVWALEDYLIFDASRPSKSMRGFGHYHERYKRDGDVWLIKNIRLQRMWIELT